MSKISEFDTNYTLLYKNAFQLTEPAKYVLLHEDGSYSSAFTFIEQKIKKESSIKIWEELRTLTENISLGDFCYMYFYVSKKNKIHHDEILNNVNLVIDHFNEDSSTEAYENNQKYVNYDTITQLEEPYRFWYREYNKEKDKDRKIYINIIEIQTRLESTDVVEIKNLEIESSSFEYETIYDSQIPTIFDGISIFNDMGTNIYIPYIQWNDPSDKKYYKVFESDEMKNYDMILRNQFRKMNTLYFLVMVGEPNETLTTKTYTICSYYLDKNVFKVNVPLNRKTIVLDRIKKMLNKLKLNKERQFNLRGKFNIPSFIMDTATLHFLLMNDDIPGYGLNSILSTYLYIDEGKSSVVNRDRISIRYKTIEPPEEDDLEEDSEFTNPSSATLSITEGENEFNIMKVKSRDILDKFLKIFTRLLSIYEEYKESALETIADAVSPEEEYEEGKKKKREKKLDALVEVAGEVFTRGENGYSRKCNCNRQPIIVDDSVNELGNSEIDDWKNKTFYQGKDEYYRQVGQFPPTAKDKDVMFKFVCPDDDYPYPGLISNAGEFNSDKYPYVPCCAADDNIKNPNSLYNNYDKKPEELREVGAKGYKIKTLKVLEYREKGGIPKPIQDLLASVNPDDKFEFERFGVGRSPNSILHCILNAKQSEYYDYMSLTMPKKEEYCRKIRRQILTRFQDMSIFKQELFDMNDQEIRNMIHDDTLFLDPALFYRGLEEMFDVNIFVFSPGNETVQEPFFEIPRHKLVHIRPYRPERLSIIIIKHMGGSSEDLKYPQCELIVNSGSSILDAQQSVKRGKGRPTKSDLPSKKTEFLFTESMTEVLYNSLLYSSKNFVFNFRPQDIEEKVVETRLQPYSKIKWDDIFENPLNLEYQTVDSYGKVRALTFKIGEEDVRVTVFIPPTQPLDLPSKPQIYYSSKNIIEKIFGKYKKETKDGLWYSVIDFEYGFFVPCNTDSKDKIPPSPVQIDFAKEMNRKPNPVEHYRNIKKYSKILIDLIIWGLRSNGILNLKDFNKKFESYMEIKESVKSNILPKKIYRKIPDKGNFSTLHAWWPEYFSLHNKVQLNKSLYERLKVYLKRYYVETDGLSLPANPYLNNVYEYEWDFVAHPFTRILIDESHFEAWNLYYKSKKNGGNIINIHINQDILIGSNDPVLFKDEKTGKIYILQNVLGRERERALFLTKHWRDYKFNFGYNCPVLKGKDLDIPYAIYKISNDSKLEFDSIQSSVVGIVDDYLQILTFGPNYYVAMLPLL